MFLVFVMFHDIGLPTEVSIKVFEKLVLDLAVGGPSCDGVEIVCETSHPEDVKSQKRPGGQATGYTNERL
jgi:hypothetical protein